jgi:hypothetical protein
MSFFNVVLNFYLDNYIFMIIFMLFFIAPVLILLTFFRFIIDRIMKRKRINNVVISIYAWKKLSYDANFTKTSTKKRIERILNFVVGQEVILEMMRKN